MTHRTRRRLGPLPIWRSVRRSRHGRTVSWAGALFGTRWRSRRSTTRIRSGGGPLSRR
ncbi:hypothetical protein ACLFMI_13060 [Pseudonocardia nantongensis]|uniref:hypothetical protein n=1 Tax=Pseudonocardia nantongensis TaxID=1181885 RepID=UPI0039790FB2